MMKTSRKPSPKNNHNPPALKPNRGQSSSQQAGQHHKLLRSQKAVASAAKPVPAKQKLSPVSLKSHLFQHALLKKWITDGVAFILLFGGTTFIGGAAWFSYQLIVNPDIGIWLNQILPAWTQIPLQRRDTIQTLEEINQSLQAQGLVSGKPIALPNLEQRSSRNSPLPSLIKPSEALVERSSDLLIPVMKKRTPSVAHPCEAVCQEIVQLHVYEAVKIPYQRLGSTQYYRLIHQLETQGPAESFVIASLIGTQANQQGSNKPSPLTELVPFKGKIPQFGLWFNLNSERVVGDKTVPYGQIIHYNPIHQHLSMMLEWKSAAGQQPIWQEVTGGKDPELLIEQTIGLEPQFSIYQVQPLKFVPNPIQLTAISLDEIFLDNYNYRQALRLARSGLWSPALDLIKPLKTNAGKTDPSIKWTTAVQAQLDLIEFHAKITKAQAAAAWASPNQQILASLIDGRWTEALDVLRSSQGNNKEIGELLRANGGRIQNRLDAALLENPNQRELQTWGALIVGSKSGRNEAIAWLDQQPENTQETRAEVLQLLLTTLATEGE